MINDGIESVPFFPPFMRGLVYALGISQHRQPEVKQGVSESVSEFRV